jgi:WhiB family redox-sensing transcriptional regulator
MTHGLDSNWPAWVQTAACLEIGTDAFYPVGNADDWETPRKVCLERCPVRAECLDDVMARELGMDYKTRHGIIGGLSPIERHAHQPEWLAGQESAA